MGGRAGARRLVLAAALLGCHRNALPPRPDGAAVVVAAPVLDGEVALGPETEPNDTIATAQRLDLATGTVRGVSARLHEGQGKARDTDVYRIDIVAPDGGTPAPPPPAAAADGAPVAPSAPTVVRRSLRIDLRPEPLLAVSLDALDDSGQTLVAAGSGQAGEALAIPNLAVTPGTYYVRVRPGATAGTAAAAGAGVYRLIARLGPLDPGAEVEPNGKAALATDLAPDGEAVGYAGWRRDQDWYRVPVDGLAEGSVLSADLEPVPGLAASLLVYDSVEQKLLESRGRKEERVALRNVRVPPNEPALFVVVRADSGWNGDVRYDLRLRTEVPKSGGEAEPNDDPAHAQPIAEGTLLGYLARGDTDVFRFAAAAPTELDVEVAPPERVDARLEILREDGAVLARSDAGKRREAERIPNLFVPGGAVLIRVSAGKGDGNPDEPYRLSVTARPPEPDAEREPNDSADKATPLAVGARGGGLIAPRGDVDFWQVPATPDAEGNVPVSVTGVPGLTLDVRVRGQAGRELARFKVPGAAPVSQVVTASDACCLVEIREATGRAANARDRYGVVVGK
jgi:hypothetical protein